VEKEVHVITAKYCTIRPELEKRVFTNPLHCGSCLRTTISRRALVCLIRAAEEEEEEEEKDKEGRARGVSSSKAFKISIGKRRRKVKEGAGCCWRV
jgi:hypothetical protein